MSYVIVFIKVSVVLMQENVLIRLAQFIKAKGLSIRAFEQKAGLSNATVSRAIKNNTSFAVEHLEKIGATFPELNLNWLVKGEGEMLAVALPTSNNALDLNAVDSLIQLRIEELLQKRGVLA
jgi:transcriptional regulator with XRE-family HTH domain